MLIKLHYKWFYFFNFIWIPVGVYIFSLTFVGNSFIVLLSLGIHSNDMETSTSTFHIGSILHIHEDCRCMFRCACPMNIQTKDVIYWQVWNIIIASVSDVYSCVFYNTCIYHKYHSIIFLCIANFQDDDIKTSGKQHRYSDTPIL